MANSYVSGETDNRPWGTWEVISAEENYTLKRIMVAPGQRLSLQLHYFRSEHWIVVNGKGVVTIGGDEFPIKVGSHVFIPMETKHRVVNDGDVPLVFVELQYGKSLDENDIVRIEDDYSRQ